MVFSSNKGDQATMNSRHIQELHSQEVEAKQILMDGAHNAKFTALNSGIAHNSLQVASLNGYRLFEHRKRDGEAGGRRLSPEHVASVTDALEKYNVAMRLHAGAQMTLEEAHRQLKGAELAYTEYVAAIMKIVPDDRF